MTITNTEAADIGRALAIEVKNAIALLTKKIAHLETMLEQRNFAYLGVWKDGKIYNPGSFVTHSGAIWHSNVFHNTTRPGDGDVAWTLAVKFGRDGKDAGR